MRDFRHPEDDRNEAGRGVSAKLDASSNSSGGLRAVHRGAAGEHRYKDGQRGQVFPAESQIKWKRFDDNEVYHVFTTSN